MRNPRPTALTGTVRGIAEQSVSTPNGDTRVTLTTASLDLLTPAVTVVTGITRLGIDIQTSSFPVGDRITQAIYQPITRELIQFDLAAAAR